MAKQLINIGSSANDGTGDTLRDGADKVNDNFNEVYNLIGDGTNVLSGIVTHITAGDNISINSSSNNVTITGLANTARTSTESLVVSGVTTLTGAVGMGGNLILSSGSIDIKSDNKSLFFGDKNEFQVFTNGTNMYFDFQKVVSDVSAELDGLFIRDQNDTDILGLTTTGNLTLSTGSLHIDSDSKSIFLGDGDDFEIFTDGSNMMFDFNNETLSNLIIRGHSNVGIVTIARSTGAIGVAGSVTAPLFYGDGSNLTGINTGSGDTVSITASAADILSVSSGAVSADDAGADKLVFWDDGASKLTYLTLGSGLSISGTTISSGVSLNSRVGIASTVSGIGTDSSQDFSIDGYKSYSLLKVTSSHASRIRLYIDAASRTSDASRTSSTDPLPGIGLIAETSSTTSGISTFIMSPGVIGWNNDVSVGSTIYGRVTNNESTTVENLTITLTVVGLEA